MQSDRNEIYYTACWRELQSFLAEVVRTRANIRRRLIF